ncbi:MAG: hypothetical protein A2X80_07845 [Geobacteraceae bacterium GWB2_52_12]|nr:MAG: hypothetical protein A2X80_07845 [Geobacteraceae bacterium GWB2_52_12]
MADFYSEGVFQPSIPADLITYEAQTLFDALNICGLRQPDDTVRLFNECSCTSGFVTTEEGQKEVGEEDLYRTLQDIIRVSNGRLTWISHEQGHTCSKKRSEGFGGSAVFITADDIQYNGTSPWLERRLQEFQSGDIGPDTEDPDVVTSSEVIEAVNDLINAAKVVVKRWESGNLAEAVTNLSMMIRWMESILKEAQHAPHVALQPDVNQKLLEACIQARAALPDAWAAVNCNVPEEVIDLLNEAIALAAEERFKTSWWLKTDGEHKYFTLDDWRNEASQMNTLLGYQEWVIKEVESLLSTILLDGVDAIEVSGCIEEDGNVEVTLNDEEASFFSVYTHRPNEGVECQCDFNTRRQAIEFAKALAAKRNLRIYGEPLQH